MRAGMLVELPDGKIGTVVYNGLDGVGIKWGEHKVKQSDISGNGGISNDKAPEGYRWFPDAMLRDSYPSRPPNATPCVGEKYKTLTCRSCSQQDVIVRLLDDRSCPRCEPEGA